MRILKSYYQKVDSILKACEMTVNVLIYRLQTIFFVQDRQA
jgi:hypothetical protein